MNKKLLVTTIGVLSIIMIMMTVKPVLAIIPTCQGCGASSLSPGTEAKSSGDAKNLAPGQEAKIPIPTCQNCDAKDFTPGHEGQNAGIIGPSLKK
jgi:hypothetical protein